MPDAGVVFRTALAILIFLQAGLWLLSLLREEGDPLSLSELSSLAFGLGVGSITFELLLMGIASIPFRLAIVLAPWALAWVILLIAGRGRLRRVLRVQRIRPPESLTGREEAVAVVLLCLLVGVVLLVIAHAWLFPIGGWDEWMIWDSKARAFWADAAIKPFLADNDAHQDYPLLFPLAGTFFYLVLGRPHAIVQILPAMFFVGILAQFAAGLRRLGGSTLLVIASTAGLACLPPVLAAAHAFMSESAVTYYELASIMAMVLYLREGRPSLLWLAAITAGFATQVRAEAPFVLAGPVALLLIRAATQPAGLDRRRAWAAGAIYAGVVGALWLPWTLASRALTASVGRSLTGDNFAALLFNRGTLLHVVGTLAEWAVNPLCLGAFILLVPLAAVLVAWRWRQVFEDWGATFLLVSALWTPVPYIAFFIAQPEALHPDAMGRYLGGALVLLYTFIMSQLIAMNGGLRRLVLTVGIVSLVLWIGADLRGWLGMRLYHVRPVQLARQVFADGETLAGLTPLEKVQWWEQGQVRMGFASMLPALLTGPLPPGDAILFVSRGTLDAPPNGYIHRRLMYLLYPHRVKVIDDPATLEHVLATSPVSTLIVYAQTPPLEHVSGEVVFMQGGHYVVIREPRLRPGSPPAP